jgi:hypothetical protein
MKATIQVSVRGPITFKDLQTIIEDLEQSGWKTGPLDFLGLTSEASFAATKDFMDPDVILSPQG